MVFGKLKIFQWTLSSCFIFWNKIKFLIDGIAIRFHFLFLFFSCLYSWLMFIWSPVEKIPEGMFKFKWTIILNFWNRVLKIQNRIFAKNWFNWTYLTLNTRINSTLIISSKIDTKCWSVVYQRKFTVVYGPGVAGIVTIVTRYGDFVRGRSNHWLYNLVKYSYITYYKYSYIFCYF